MSRREIHSTPVCVGGTLLSVAPERFPGGEQTVAGSFFHCLLALGGGEEGQKRKDKGPLLTPVNAAKDAAIEESERSRGGRGGKVEMTKRNHRLLTRPSAVRGGVTTAGSTFD